MNRYIPRQTVSALAAALLAATLSACSTLATPDGLGDTARVDARVPAALPFAVADVRADSLATLYGDPLLAAYLDRALAANTDLALSRTRLVQAAARLRQARARTRPFVSGDASLGVATLLSDVDIADSAGLGIGIAYDPDLFGALRNGVDGAAAREAIATAELARLRRVVLALTAQSYLQVVAADAQLALARENFDFLGETLRVSRARFEAGDTARADFALSEAEYENARAALAQQELGVRDARRALATLLNAYADEDLPVAPRLPRAQTLVGLEASADRAVLSRYDVRAARLSVITSVSDYAATRADTLPSISLTGRVGGGLALSDLFDIDTYLARLAVAVTDTLYSGGLEAARVDEARSRVDSALIGYEAEARNAYRELVESFDRARVFQTRLAALEAASTAAEQALALEEIRYDLGEAILLDVLTVQRRVNTIRASRISTESGYLQALADAHLAAGPVRVTVEDILVGDSAVVGTSN